MSPKKIIEIWVDTFNSGDTEALVNLYAEDAINHQVPQSPVVGRKAIKSLFAEEFSHTNMTCIPENIVEDGKWAILEWKDPLGLRGCGFFNIENGKIVFQRGYWDKLSFLRLHKLPIPQA